MLGIKCLSSSDICCSDLVPMVTVLMQTEIFMGEHTFQKVRETKRKVWLVLWLSLLCVCF